MMTQKRKNYTAEFKQEAVRLVTEQGYSMSQAARNLDININMLRRWKHQINEQGQEAFPGKGRLLPEQEELYRLREENKRLRMERDILKKTVTFFANESR
jgi:transposase